MTCTTSLLFGRKARRFLGLAAAAIGAAAFSGFASAQCNSFTVTQTAGASIVPGTTQIANNGDDVSTAITLPFAWSIYGTSYTSAVVCSNGWVSFTNPTTCTGYVNSCLPGGTLAAACQFNSVHGVTIMPHWDDLRTDQIGGTGRGIFTSVSGPAGSQVFEIEWRAAYFATNTINLNFQVRIYENSARFDFIYGDVPNGGVSATIGVQQAGTAGSAFTQFSCNTSTVTQGTMLQFDCPSVTNPTCLASASPGTVTNDGTGMTLLTVNVTPAIGPPSTAHIVNADLTNIGGAASVPMVEGPANTFTLMAAVAQGTGAGPQAVTFTVIETAPQNRMSNCVANVTIPTGACCVNTACVAAQTPNDCAVAGGTYRGDASLCGGGCACVVDVPANDLCDNAITILVPSTTTGSTCNATSDTANAPTCVTTTGAPGIWYKIAGTGNTITASTCDTGTLYDTKVSVYCASNGCSALTCISGNDDFTCPGSTTLPSRVVFCSQDGAEYYILVHGFGAAQGAFTLILTDDEIACTATVECIPTGACCTAGGCSISSEAACMTAGGTYLGDNTVCSTSTLSYTNTYTSTPGIPIPDAPGAAITDIINVPDVFTFTDVSVRVEIPDHTFIGDLFIMLSKGATTVVVWDNQCGGNNGMTITFSDAGVAVVCAQPTSGEYLPFAALGFGAETSDGDWTISVQDQVGIDIGTLAHWELRFNRTVTTMENCNSCHGDCVADFDDGSMTGTPDGGVTIDDLLYYLFIFDLGDVCADVDDGSFTGTQDGGVTIDDLLYFLFRFDQGC